MSFRSGILAALFLAFVAGISPAQCPGGQCPVQPGRGIFQPRPRPSQSQDSPAVDPVLGASSVMIPGWGSGVIVHVGDGKALVITAQHVIADNSDFDGKVIVRFIDGRTVSGHVVEVQDQGDDLAAILIPADSKTPYIPVAKDAPKPGDVLTQLGYSGAEPGRGPYQRIGKVKRYAGPWMYTTHVIYSGDSGSGVYDGDKKLCGIAVRGNLIQTLSYEHRRLKRFYDQCVEELFPKKAEPVLLPAVQLQAAPQLDADKLNDKIDQLFNLILLVLGASGASGAAPIVSFLYNLYKQRRDRGKNLIRRRK
jgi:hypothetical protein